MAKILILYYSKSGNTEKMARLVEEGVKAEKVDVDVKDVAVFAQNWLKDNCTGP